MKNERPTELPRDTAEPSEPASLDGADPPSDSNLAAEKIRRVLGETFAWRL